MPLDPKSIRTPSFRAKLSQLTGVAADEKALLQRIGALMDTLVFTQRQAGNPRDRRRFVRSDVPVPQNVQVNGITGGITATWDPVDVAKLAFYEAQVSESTTFATGDSQAVLGNTFSFRAQPASGTLFFRVRTVIKGGDTSLWAQTQSVTVGGSTIFSADQDYIDPENRTTVSPKPTLTGASLDSVSGNKVFIGIGAHIGPSPLTFSDTGLSGNTNLRNEITYDTYETNSPFPSLEQRRAPSIGEFIDEEAFYTFSDSFYLRFATLTNSITDFFDVQDMNLNPSQFENPSQFDTEFLRYRTLGTFYAPAFPQTGIVLNASTGIIRF